MPEEVDKDTEDTSTEDVKEEESTEASTDEESVGDQSKETDKPVTAEDAMNLAVALQKGYTMTRQDMASIRDNQEKIQEALTELRKSKVDEFGGDEDEPLTVKKFLNIQEQQQKAKTKRLTIN